MNNLSTTRKIYTLNGLPPEIIAVTFAKCSRSPESFDTIAQELNEDKSRQFHEKWVIGYGHSSVAEHAMLSIAIENISVLATKVLEDNRLASYTEKSTRYQQFDKARYFVPELSPDLSKVYVDTINYIMNEYTTSIPMLKRFNEKKYPHETSVKIRNITFDDMRYFLPVSVLTNLGVTINARSLEYAIAKLLTHPLQEMKDIGEDIKKTVLNIVPTLIKYADFNEYIDDTNKKLEHLAADALQFEENNVANDVELVDYDSDAEEKIIAALLYRFSNLSYNTIKDKIKNLNDLQKQEIIAKSLEGRTQFDKPSREFEQISYTFDILIDFGAFRDIQRHRMLSQINQNFAPSYGYNIPQGIIEAGLEKQFMRCMEMAHEGYNKICKKFPQEASYVLPMAFKKRVLFKVNLRELYHLIELRTTSAAHSSYKKIAQNLHNEISKVHPFLAKFIGNTK